MKKFITITLLALFLLVTTLVSVSAYTLNIVIVPKTTPAVTPVPSASVAANTQGIVLTADEKRFLELTNQARIKNGLKPLAVDPRLVQTARLKAEDMAKLGYFGHISPTYGKPSTMMIAYGIKDYRWIGGENLAQNSTVDRAFNALMNSPTHRANILDPRYTHIGVASVPGGRYGKLWVQHFCGK
ncbi:CAP domain-containing protein [Carboxydothermus hydrogenoformans]|uniref:SCP-like extracellular protein n=1 Tax=Carboxydothermus hydrogenoformans (strain ATCC BAA-161 / DSM 6008 / Z-2901) TaxID=246194 RepID=Q3A8Z1_CARHZ|nr:CAP domain-containing protein [Carboxydothermus hydrogenoformans]ABB14770.1 SCP-like extracellular protein [Carboxydothermus hydrogenoformans Z-2901]